MASEEPVVAGVAGRYAAALFDLAREQNLVVEIENDLVKFQQLYAESADLRAVVRSPIIPAHEQALTLASVMGMVGIGPLTQNFFRLVAKNRRLFAASDMARAYRALAAKARGEVPAEVTSAHPLTDAQIDAVRSTLRASIGKDITLSSKVDPSLLGGLVVKVGSRMVDSSLRTKLQGMKVAMKG